MNDRKEYDFILHDNRYRLRWEMVHRCYYQHEMVHRYYF